MPQHGSSTIIEEAERVSREAQRKRPARKRGWTAVPDRVFQVTRYLRAPRSRVLWYIIWRTLGQKGKATRPQGIRLKTMADKLGLPVRRVKLALEYLERRELIVSEPSQRGGATKYRLGDWLLEHEDEDGPYVGGYTEVPNAAWPWLTATSDPAWRLLTGLIRSIEPKGPKKAQRVRRRSTIQRRSGLSARALLDAQMELERIGLAEITPLGIEAATGESVPIPRAARLPRGYVHAGSDHYDLQGLYEYPDYEKILRHPPTFSATPLANNRVQSRTPTNSLSLYTPPRRKDSPSYEGSSSFQNHGAPVLDGEDDPPRTRPRGANSKHTLTPEESRAFLLGAPSVWRDMRTRRRWDGSDNLKLDPWPWCGGNDCSVYVGEEDDPDTGRIAGAGRCWNCGRSFHLAELVRAVVEADGEGEVSRRRIVALIREAGRQEPPESARRRVGRALAGEA